MDTERDRTSPYRRVRGDVDFQEQWSERGDGHGRTGRLVRNAHAPLQPSHTHGQAPVPSLHVQKDAAWRQYEQHITLEEALDGG